MMRNSSLAVAATAAAVTFTVGCAANFPSFATAYVPGRHAMVVSRHLPNIQHGPAAAKVIHESPAQGLGPLGMSLAPSPDETSAGKLESDIEMPEQNDDGLYEILNKEQHQAFLKANPDKIVILKFYAPWCRACKGLAPKFLKISQDPKYAKLPILWAQMSIQHNKDYIKSIGVLALPSMHFYAGAEGVVENFPCGPSKLPIFREKLAATLNEKIDPRTFQLKQAVTKEEIDCTAPGMAMTEPCADRAIVSKGSKTELSVGSAVVSEERWNFLRNDIPFFKDFDDEEFSELMKKAKLQTFEAGGVIMRQGKEGRTFYVIDSGEVEISVDLSIGDPLTSPSDYLGAVINRLGEKEYFGERSLITGDPRSASIRATEKTRCFAFDVDDIPASSVLSGKRSPTSERLAQVNDKYGVDIIGIDYTADQFKDANVANQERGSLNSPETIKGVDTDEDIEVPEMKEKEEEMDFYPGVHVNGNDDMVISLLLRFQLIRHAARCFEYIVHTQPTWGDKGESKRRSMLVSKLTPAQREEFTKVFKLIDEDGDGTLSLLELKRAMMSVGEEKTDDELRDMINKADPSIDGNIEINFHDFMGVMAEAEFYYLFMQTFKVLDKHNSGFVKASELDKALCGVRDLISDDRKSIIDVEDKDMQIDYEQFAKMLLGADVRH